MTRRCRLFTFLSAASLLLCAASVVLWVQSYRVAHGATWRDADQRAYSFASYCGGVALACEYGVYTADYDADSYPDVGRLRWHSFPDPTHSVCEWRSPAEATGPRYRWAGWAYEQRVWPAGTQVVTGGGRWSAVRNWSVAVPDWAVAGVFAAAPLMWAVRRRRRPRPGLCPGCGYDLRASPGRCPECGAGPKGPTA